MKLTPRKQAINYEMFIQLSDEPPTITTINDAKSGIEIEKTISDSDELAAEYNVTFCKRFVTLNEFELNSLIEYLEDIRDARLTKHLDV